MKRQSLHVKDNAVYDHFTKQQVIWTHGYGATDRYVTRNEWGALLLQWPVRSPTYRSGSLLDVFISTVANFTTCVQSLMIVAIHGVRPPGELGPAST